MFTFIFGFLHRAVKKIVENVSTNNQKTYLLHFIVVTWTRVELWKSLIPQTDREKPKERGEQALSLLPEHAIALIQMALPQKRLQLLGQTELKTQSWKST